jgi:hypothetical protein
MNDYRGSAINDYRMVVIFSAMLLKNEPLWNMDDYRDSATVYMNDYTMHGCYF